MGIISFIILGLIVGALARLVLPGRQPIGILWTIALGMVGALAGGLLATEVLNIADSDEFNFGSLLLAVGVSALLLGLLIRFAADRDDRVGRGLRT
jgi:uncharacterized membrane protein YeaQ/YmgE (transglycosylase-associated protein family)